MSHPTRVAMRILFAAVAVVLATAGAAEAGSLRFSDPMRLPHGTPGAHPYFHGAEPSIAFDPSGDGHVYVVAPQGGLGRLIGTGRSDSPTGVAYWASEDHGATFPVVGTTGSGVGGADSDVEVLADGTVLVADQQLVAASAICRSRDFARTFPDCARGFTPNQQAALSDRPWLTRGARSGEVYLAHRAAVTGLPIISKSVDGGKSFTPCGSIVDLAGPAGRTISAAAGTLVARPVLNAAGDLFVLFALPGSASHLYLAVAKRGCPATKVFKNYVIYEHPGAFLKNIFPALTIDGGGQLYVLMAGKTKPDQRMTRLWLFTSTDAGRTWSPPLDVAPPSLTANVFPTLGGGVGRGEAVLAWYGTQSSDDPHNTRNQWRLYGAATYDGARTFNHAVVTRDVMHYGSICRDGPMCREGTRNLLDFASIAIDPSNGCTAIAFPADPYNRPDTNPASNTGSSSAYVSFQQDRTTCLTADNAGKPASAVGRACTDDAPPRSHFTRRRLTAPQRRGVMLTGRATDRGCGARGRGRVQRVLVALGRHAGPGRCRYVRRDGRLGRPTNCHRTKYLRAQGTTNWRLRYAQRLRAGRYFAWARAIDAAGNVERKNRRHNLIHLQVR